MVCWIFTTSRGKIGTFGECLVFALIRKSIEAVATIKEVLRIFAPFHVMSASTELQPWSFQPISAVALECYIRTLASITVLQHWTVNTHIFLLRLFWLAIEVLPRVALIDLGPSLDLCKVIRLMNHQKSPLSQHNITIKSSCH